jgi:protein-S-isoprenylcysteine O-methyltransferase Ste14
MLLLSEHAAARGALFGMMIAGAVAEAVVTRRRRGDRPPTASTLDRGTKQVLVLATLAGLFAGALLARYVPALRVGANTWLTYAVGLGVLAFGIVLRVSAVWSLGRYFRREVTIEAGQTVHSSGPYRWLRHPAYTGDLLIVFGFGLAWGSWIGAAAGTALALAGHLPRIRVEEDELRRALGEPYERYANGRARLVPGVW